ncbi:MAG: hypothetical protein HY078_16270 [Elusimicrobia bacterium]|nr:hypothetical protein [Elusimicrobiota bacterium]
MIKNMYLMMKQAVVPILLGWILTCWLPVPSPLHGAATTAWSAVCNGVHAMVTTISKPPADNGAGERKHAESGIRGKGKPAREPATRR